MTRVIIFRRCDMKKKLILLVGLLVLVLVGGAYYHNYGKDMVIRHVRVDRSRTPIQAIVATGFSLYPGDDIRTTMRRGYGSRVTVVFFKLSGSMIDFYDVKRECQRRWLRPVDPYSLAKVNEDDPDFVREHSPNGTYWLDSVGWGQIISFNYNDDQRVVESHHADGFAGEWWFAGVPFWQGNPGPSWFWW